MSRLFWFFIGVLMSTLMIAPYSYAFSPTGSPNYMPYSGVAFESGSTSGVSGGVNVTRAGTSTYVRNGMSTIKIPISLTTTVSKAAVGVVASAAFKVARLATPIGLGITGWQIYDAYKESGLTVCSPPDFFCKSNPADYVPKEVISGWYDSNGAPGFYNSGQAICDYYSTTNRYGDQLARTYVPNAPGSSGYSTASGRCVVTLPDGRQIYGEYPSTNGPSTCPTGYSSSGSQCITGTPNPPIPATDSDFENAANTDIQNDSTGVKAKKYWDAANAANEKAKQLGVSPVPSSQMLPSNSPTVMDAPPLTVPQVLISTEDFIDADGVPQTRTKQQTTTVTPQKNGDGSATEIINNITNVITTTTTTNTQTTTNNPPKVETKTEQKQEQFFKPPEPIEFPEDYNKEVTQKKISDELSGLNAPDAPVDQDARTQIALAETDTGLSDIFTYLPNQFISDKSNWFSWVWTPPVGVCNASDYSGTVHGNFVSWDICPTVSNIRDVIGWLFAIFGAYIIYGQIFKGSK